MRNLAPEKCGWKTEKEAGRNYRSHETSENYMLAREQEDTGKIWGTKLWCNLSGEIKRLNIYSTYNARLNLLK